MSTSENDFTSRLIERRLEVYEFLGQSGLVSRWTPRPGLAALSLLSSREDSWAAHCLIVGFAAQTSADPESRNAIRNRLGENTLDKWLHDEQFTEFLASRAAMTPEIDLLSGFAIIEQALNPHAVVEAQWASILLEYCMEHCRNRQDRRECFLECIGR
ncbi:hypothetical protein ACFWHQ_19965 [Streptomyces sp. NPDC060334]|uniref:hypothetical protein n=1 Tax=Streptomyces sp. NPDC060334 TaxID=3347099 RepID=UPI0036697BE9